MRTVRNITKRIVALAVVAAAVLSITSCEDLRYVREESYVLYWRKANPDAAIETFKFSPKKLNPAGSLFDYAKLVDVSKNVISRMTAEEVYEQAAAWAERFDPALHARLTKDADYAKGLFAIDRGGKKPRKDILRWKDVAGYTAYFFDETFVIEDAAEMEPALQKQVLEAYLAVVDAADDKDTWFNKIKDICEPLGFSPDVKAYKAAPEQFKGHVGDVSNIIRVAVTGRTKSPDLYSIMKTIGKERVLNRISAYKGAIS